ncbi:MAG: nitrilase-related carbon-nitrogen hydrolase, partial [Candidatus Margulisiibacteriota bacterium]
APKANTAEPVDLILVQPALSWRSVWYSFENNYLSKQNLGKLVSLSKQAALSFPTATLIWPEMSVVGTGLTNKTVTETLNKIPWCNNLVLGAKDLGNNSLVSLNRHSRKLSRYNKSRLIPFFETDKILPGNISAPVPIGNDRQKLGAYICYENLFPQVSRELVRQGAEFIGCISFNTWLGTTNWPLLQMAYVTFRAAENNRYAFYLNNNGPSLAVEPSGRIIGNIPFGSPGYLCFKAQSISVRTFYSEHGDLFVLWMSLLTLLMLFWERRVSVVGK